jgi:3-phenylpropionate/cinnamic acid dioxygenase small subunit
MSDGVRREVEALLFLECRLLEERRYAEWLGLFAEVFVYWMPAGGDDPDPREHVSLILDSRARMTMRIDRLLGGRAFAQDPVSRTMRSLSNIELESAAEGVVGVNLVLTVGEVRAGIQRTYMARCKYLLDIRAGWKIARKEVWLLNRSEVLDNLSLIF